MNRRVWGSLQQTQLNIHVSPPRTQQIQIIIMATAHHHFVHTLGSQSMCMCVCAKIENQWLSPLLKLELLLFQHTLSYHQFRKINPILSVSQSGYLLLHVTFDSGISLGLVPLAHNSKIHYERPLISCPLLEKEARGKEEPWCTLDDLQKAALRYFLFLFCFSVPIKGDQKGRDSIPPLGVINHGFLGASAY